MPDPSAPSPSSTSAAHALKALFNPSSNQTAGQLIRSTADYQKASRAGAISKKAAQARLNPVRSALVRQKIAAGRDLKPIGERIKQAGGAAKSLAGQDVAKLKQAASPYKQMLGQDKAAAKKALGADKKAVLKALTPERSALVRAKKVGGKDLAGIKSVLGQDMGKAKQGMAGLKQTAQQSAAGDEARKAKGWAKKASKTPLGRLLTGGG